MKECERPKNILTYNGKQFNCKEWVEVLKQEGTLPVFTSMGHLQSNSSERYIWQVGTTLRQFIYEDNGKWMDLMYVHIFMLKYMFL